MEYQRDVVFPEIRRIRRSSRIKRALFLTFSRRRIRENGEEALGARSRSRSRSANISPSNAERRYRFQPTSSQPVRPLFIAGPRRAPVDESLGISTKEERRRIDEYMARRDRRLQPCYRSPFDPALMRFYFDPLPPPLLCSKVCSPAWNIPRGKITALMRF